MFKFTKIGLSIAVMASFLYPLGSVATENPVSYDYAPVVHSSPITRIEKHSTPYQDCWNERVQINVPYPAQYTGNSYSDALFGRNAYTGTVLGGLVGGGIGHALGHHKSNKKAGAIAGGILGSAVGYDLTRNRPAPEPGYQAPRYENQQRCKTRYETFEEEKVVGYQVQYRYNGQTYSTRTQTFPGDSIRLKIVATPMEY